MEEERHLIFGKYETGRLLGKGSFAKVYYGKHIETGQSVAIKVICKDLLKKQIGLMDQIKREISIMKLVRHPNVVELKEVMATRTKIFFVMEYVKGGELFAKVRKGKLKEDVARKYFQQIISAVDFCHSRGVSHRDLKPENLLLDEFGNVKISDFGLSALPEQLHCDGLLHTTCGTPAYVAPEVLRKHGYDGAKADLWSCGVILFVLLSGFLPFQEENLMRMYCKVFKADYEFPPWISAEARRLISMLLVTDPDRRTNIADIMKVPWFRKGFVCPISAGQSSAETSNPLQVTFDNNDGDNNSNRFDRNEEEKGVSPQFFNAFELITSMSSGFDLSNLFERKEKAGSMFTSKCSASDIMRKFEEVARGFNFKFAKAKDFKMKLQGVNEGRKGKLEVTAEIFQVAPEVAVVEFVKSAGDTMEYIKFCEEDVRPALKDIVWSWQGDHSNTNEKNRIVSSLVNNSG